MNVARLYFHWVNLRLLIFGGRIEKPRRGLQQTPRPHVLLVSFRRHLSFHLSGSFEYNLKHFLVDPFSSGFLKFQTVISGDLQHFALVEVYLV